MTTIWASNRTKAALEGVMERRNRSSLHDTLKFLIELEKEDEMKKLTSDLTPEITRKIVREEVERAIYRRSFE